MSPPPPVRLKVAYRSAEALLGEFTRTVTRGTVELESKKVVQVGTQFVFELRAQDVERVVEVQGEVMKVTEPEPGKYILHIKYDPSADRSAIDAMLERILDAHRFEKMRKYPRIPIKLRTNVGDPKTPTFIVHDISRGGLGAEIEAKSMPSFIKPGAPFFCEVSLSFAMLQLHGEIAWAFSAANGKMTSPRFGVIFGKLRAESASALDQLLELKALPPPPWKAQMSFGMDAVSRMP